MVRIDGKAVLTYRIMKAVYLYLCFRGGVARLTEGLQLAMPEELKIAFMRYDVVCYGSCGGMASKRAKSAKGLYGELVLSLCPPSPVIVEVAMLTHVLRHTFPYAPDRLSKRPG